MATPKIIADFETQLATALAVGGTSFTLSSATDDDGVALPTGKYYFTIDNGTSQKEYVVGTLTGTSVASVSNVTRQGTESSGVDRAHRVGASVIMTDFLTYKNYIDETTVAGAADADTNTKGVVEVATLAQVRAGTGVGETGAILVVSPTELDEYPTQDEKAAMSGGGDFGTPSSSNKFITENYLNVNTTPKIVEFTSSGTWTKDTNLHHIEVTVIGGGGGGAAGGAQSGGGSAGTAGGGGGAGGSNTRTFLASQLGATETVTIGTAGVGGTSLGVYSSCGEGGTNGGDTTFGSLLTGGGGVGAAGLGGGGGGAGGSASYTITNGVTVTGIAGGAGGSGGNAHPSAKAGGVGGDSSLFDGHGTSVTGSPSVDASDPTCGGAGGASAAAGGSPSAKVASDGGVGYCLVTEYYS